ncbi:protein ACCELERATED CELL DEATH 6-like [Chenopodium quinoa]|uniref:protein ACCELERATED CELL DEATH 6-like n=1 Tax=Chenopodium quinoa TaxID=63459 RepID=UPI000B77434A|nr:protein ACCELERATED CELL DEATH 6-like [Chenopodium quinoa]
MNEACLRRQFTQLKQVYHHGYNIIHVAAQHGHHDFIEAALRSLQAADRRNLICGTNSDGDTPLHIAATQRTPVIAKQLIDLYRKLSFPEDDKAPWRIRNKDGNTPLHVALLNGGWSVRVAAYLLEIDHGLAAFTNNRNEAPLHLAVTYVHQGTDMLTIKMINTLNCQRGALSSTNSHFVDENEDDSISLVRSLLENHSEIGCLCDADGMTPLLRAAFSSNLSVVDVIINNCPESIVVCDPKGKNVLHYIRFPTTLQAKEFLEKAEIPVLLINKQDHDGNTPMHIAVMNHDFGTVKAMVRHNANFFLQNKEGVSVQTLLDQFATNKLDVSAEIQFQSKSNEFRALVEKANEKEVVKDELMSNDLYKAVCNREWQTLREMLNDEKQFLSRLLDGSNIIHLAIQGLKTYKFAKDFSIFESRSEPYPEEELIVDALKKYPILFCQTNHLGETPLHLESFHRYEFKCLRR